MIPCFWTFTVVNSIHHESTIEFLWEQMDLDHYNIQKWFINDFLCEWNECHYIRCDYELSVRWMSGNFFEALSLRLREWLPYVSWKTTTSPLRGNWVTCLLLNLFFLALNKGWFFWAGYREQRNSACQNQHTHLLLIKSFYL